MKIVAMIMITILAPADVDSTPNIDRKPPTISFTHARASNETTVAAPPTTMNGFLLPRQLSLRIPMYGCTSAPVKGPAIQTNARSDLLIPRDRRNGCTQVSMLFCSILQHRDEKSRMRRKMIIHCKSRVILTDPLESSTDQTI